MPKDDKLSKAFVISSIIAFALLYFIDRITKVLVSIKLKDNEPVKLFNDYFELFYLENKGAAWGILNGKVWLLIVFTALVICILIFFYMRIPSSSRYNLLKISSLLIISGAVGNLYDRIRYNYVVDFLYVKIIDFPVFNIADCYVTVGAILLVICLLFVYKDSELGFWFLNNKSEE
ncbi:MAG: signal peptidase II [Lachnospiraceae bacterium]|nr:signal peptidase II [Lachnospiraceae bacterium]